MQKRKFPHSPSIMMGSNLFDTGWLVAGTPEYESALVHEFSNMAIVRSGGMWEHQNCKRTGTHNLNILMELGYLAGASPDTLTKTVENKGNNHDIEIELEYCKWRLGDLDAGRHFATKVHGATAWFQKCICSGPDSLEENPKTLAVYTKTYGFFGTTHNLIDKEKIFMKSYVKCGYNRNSKSGRVDLEKKGRICGGASLPSSGIDKK